MPNSSAAKKASRQNEKRRSENRAKKSRLKTALRSFRESLEKSKEEAGDAFIAAQSLLAKAGRKGLIHTNKARRLTSRMAQKMKKAA